MKSEKSINYIFKSTISFILIFSLFMGLLLPLTNNQAKAYKNGDEWVYVGEKCDDQDQQTDDDEKDKKDDSGSKKDEAISSEGADAWLKKGTKSYKNAKILYDTYTDELGTSGAFAVGVLANVARETGGSFDENIKEIEGGQNYSGRGFGLFQFTPGEKFLNSPEGKESKQLPSQVKYMWRTEFKSRAVEAFFPRYDVKFKNVEELAKSDDIEKTTQGFYAFERGQRFEEDMVKSQAHAKKAQSVFNKDDKKADEDKLKKSLGSSGKDSGKSKTDVDTEKDKEDAAKSSEGDNKDCEPAKKKKKKDDGVKGAGWGKDGTGDHKGVQAGPKDDPFQHAWMPDKLPKQLKKYAIDPKRVDLGWKDSKNWSPTNGTGSPSNGQCVNLSTSMFGLIWTHDGTKTDFAKSKQIFGDGQDNVSFVEKVYGVKSSHKPSKGAIFSSKGGSPGGPDAAHGHTGIVSHVFKNGDVLILEQNVNPLSSGRGSGDEAGQPMTWNYRLIDKDAAEADYMTYATLDGEKGWEVNKKLKDE